MDETSNDKCLNCDIGHSDIGILLEIRNWILEILRSMYSRNYVPLFIVLTIGLLLAIIWLGQRAKRPVYQISGSAPSTAPSPSAPTSADPLVTPGPSRMY